MNRCFLIVLEFFIEQPAHVDHSRNIGRFIVKCSFEGLICILNLSAMRVNKTFIDHGIGILRILYESFIKTLHRLLKEGVAFFGIACFFESMSVESESAIAMVLPAGIRLKTDCLLVVMDAL